MTKRFGKNDRFFLTAVGLVLAAGILMFYLTGKEQGSYVKVTVNGELYGIYSLKQEQTVKIVIGETETNVLQIRSGIADMIQADCPDQLCVHQKSISRQNETIVCLPNRVVAEVCGDADAGIDSMTN